MNSLTATQRQDLWRLFTAVDTNKTGLLGQKELSFVLKSLGLTIPQHELQALVKRLGLSPPVAPPRTTDTSLSSTSPSPALPSASSSTTSENKTPTTSSSSSTTPDPHAVTVDFMGFVTLMTTAFEEIRSGSGNNSHGGFGDNMAKSNKKQLIKYNPGGKKLLNDYNSNNSNSSINNTGTIIDFDDDSENMRTLDSEIRAVFKLFDNNNDNKISVSDLLHACTQLDEHYDQTEVR